MKEIKFSHPHRQKHFDFFNQMNHPHFSITANVNITLYLDFLSKHNHPLTPGLVYLITKAAFDIPQFRWRIRNRKVFEHATLTPSFTVYTEVADVFSFCTVPFNQDPSTFIPSAYEESQKMKTNPSFEDEKGKDDYLFLSMIPWVQFTSFQHAMSYHPSDSVPRMTWGKFFKQDEKTFMPLSVQVHHAIVDGRHVGQYFKALDEIQIALMD